MDMFLSETAHRYISQGAMGSGSSNRTVQNYDPALLILRRENVDLKYVLTFNHGIVCKHIVKQKLSSCPQAYELIYLYLSSD